VGLPQETDSPSPHQGEGVVKVETVVRLVEKIRKDAWDAENAHSQEDDLYDRVLRAVARGDENARALAREALKTNDIDFPRWCA
jgi:hypothetical protein